MSLTTPHRRGEVLREVLTAVEERRDALVPLDLPGVRETFGDELSVLAAMSLRWHARLSGSLERATAQRPFDLPRAVCLGWADAADAAPGLLRVLDHYRDEPVDEAMAVALAKAEAKQHALLALMSGQAGLEDPAAGPVGRRLEQEARAERSGALARLGARAASEGEPVALASYRPRRTLLERLRALVAA